MIDKISSFYKEIIDNIDNYVLIGSIESKVDPVLFSMKNKKFIFINEDAEEFFKLIIDIGIRVVEDISEIEVKTDKKFVNYYNQEDGSISKIPYEEFLKINQKQKK